jgi:hypothetical protein
MLRISYAASSAPGAAPQFLPAATLSKCHLLTSQASIKGACFLSFPLQQEDVESTAQQPAQLPAADSHAVVLPPRFTAKQVELHLHRNLRAEPVRCAQFFFIYFLWF